MGSKEFVAGKERSGMLIGLIGEEEMCVGFMLAGIGQEAQRGTPANFMVVDKDTDETDISNCLTGLMNRNDIAIVLVSVDVANRIRPVMNKFKNSLIPNLLEIPSKDHPYNVEDDEILKMAANMAF